MPTVCPTFGRNIFGNLNQNASGDPDHDGMNNLQEYLAGTNPTNAASALKIEGTSVVGTNLIFYFTAISNHDYTVQFQPVIGTAAWQDLLEVGKATGNRIVWLTNGIGPGSNCFYRIATPVRP
jgi:hypothetical protein